MLKPSKFRNIHHHNRLLHFMDQFLPKCIIIIRWHVLDFGIKVLFYDERKLEGKKLEFEICDSQYLFIILNHSRDILEFSKQVSEVVYHSIYKEIFVNWEKTLNLFLFNYAFLCLLKSISITLRYLISNTSCNPLFPQLFFLMTFCIKNYFYLSKFPLRRKTKRRNESLDFDNANLNSLRNSSNS